MQKLGRGLDYLQLHFAVEVLTLRHIWTPVVLVGACSLCYAALSSFTSVFRISNRYVSGRTGILSRRHARISLNRVVNYRLIRPIVERVLGLGCLHIDTLERNDEIEMQQIRGRDLVMAMRRLDALLTKNQLR